MMTINLSNLPEGVKRGPKLDAEKAKANETKAGLEMPKDLDDMLVQSNGFSIKSEKGKITFLPHSKILGLWAGNNTTYTDGAKDDAAAKPDKGIGQKWWDKGWVPFAKINGADLYCIDQSPGPGGKRGQIILFRKGKPKRQLIAASLGEFITMVFGKLK